MGPEFRLADGRRAVDFLLQTQLGLARAGGRVWLAFPPEVEVHPNAFLKTMVEAGLPLDHAFVHRGARRTVQDVLDGARALFRPAQVGRTANMLPWSIILFARTTPPGRGRWTNAWEEPVDLDAVIDDALVLLEQASLPLRDAMASGRAPESMAPVHAFTCGGTHLLYSLLVSMHAGYTGRDRLQRTRRQVDLLVWRLSADMDLIRRFYAERGAAPGRDWFELDARLKLLGHAEECLAYGTRRGVLTLTSAQQAQRRAGVAAVRDLLQELEGKRMDQARAVNPELFRQLVGDVCHARHGLTLS